jgi:hypothetical protein
MDLQNLPPFPPGFEPADDQSQPAPQTLPPFPPGFEPVEDQSETLPVGSYQTKPGGPILNSASGTPTQGQPQDTGVVAGIKRNTVGVIDGLYHAFSDPATDEEKAALVQKVRDHNQTPDVKNGKIPPISEEGAENPSRGALALHRLVDAPASMLVEKGKNEEDAALDLLKHHQYWSGSNLYLSGLADRALSAVPLVGPTVGSIAERAEHGDISGAATDVASAWAAEHAPAVLGKAAQAVGETAQKLAPESMNSLLRANRQTNYLYGKNPGQAFIDEKIKIPKNAITYGGQLENLHGQLESATENLNDQIKAALSDPKVAAKKIDIVPTVKDTIANAKKFVAKQTGLDVPKYSQELSKLEDSILTRYDAQGNPTGKVTGTKLSPAEVADVKKSLGKNTQWNVLPTDPDLQLKSYLNSIRKKIYGQLADSVEQAAPNANVKALNQRLANSIEAQGLLEKRIAYEHGTGGYGAAIRKAEFWGGLATALFSPEPISKTAGAAAVADRMVRSVPGKLTTAKTLDTVGKTLQSGVGHGVAEGAGVATLAAPVAAQLPNKDQE